MVGTAPSPRLVALATAVPPHILRQPDVQLMAQGLFERSLGKDTALLQVFDHAQIETRNSCVPLEWFSTDHSFAEKNDRYVANAQCLAGDATWRALSRARLEPNDIDHIVFVSSTGLATPSVDAHVANALGFRHDVRRTPIWGLGCAGGAVGLARAREFALADPTARVLVIALELCSLTFQYNDHSKRNLVATSIFGDGAAAAIVLGTQAAETEGDGRRQLNLVASHSTLWKDTTDVMGWEVDGAGLHVVFSSDIPTIVHERLRPSLELFLGSRGLDFKDLQHFIVHPGGAKVLRAYAEALGASPEAFHHAREVLRQYGNMSSPSCLFVLDRFLESHDIAPGERAVIAALGPGFCAEYVLAEGAAA